MSQVIAPLLYVYALFRGIDLFTHGGAARIFAWREETGLFWLEIGLFVIAPIILLSQEKIRRNPQHLYFTCSLVVMGFIANRLNISVTAFQSTSGFYYVPKWTEFALTLATVTAIVDMLSLRRSLSRHPAQKQKSRTAQGGREMDGLTGLDRRKSVDHLNSASCHS